MDLVHQIIHHNVNLQATEISLHSQTEGLYAILAEHQPYSFLLIFSICYKFESNKIGNWAHYCIVWQLKNLCVSVKPASCFSEQQRAVWQLIYFSGLFPGPEFDWQAMRLHMRATLVLKQNGLTPKFSKYEGSKLKMTTNSDPG